MGRDSGQDARFVNRKILASEIDRRLAMFCEQQAHAAQTVDLSFERLWQVIGQVLAAGGKRLRPYMVLLGYQLYGGSDQERVMPVALGQELLHAALLVHDDIMDQALVRHGTPNVTGRYVEYYQGAGLAPELARRHAEGAALLAGDLLLSAAQSFVLSAQVSDAQRTRLSQLFDESMFHVTAGQLLDVEAGRPLAYEVPAETIAQYKTASYSFVGPLRSGAVVAGADEAALTALGDFGATLGLAYQLADDIDGAFGDSTSIGKSTLSDLRDGKRTLLEQVAFKQADAEQRAVLERYFGRPDLDEAGAEQLREVMKATGALAAAERKLVTYYVQALEQAESFGEPVTDQGRQVLREFVQLVLPRAAQLKETA